MAVGVSDDWRFHPQRDALLAEAHARPYTPLTAPMLVTRIATLSGQAGEADDRAHMAALCRRLGQPEPGPDARWCTLEGDRWRLRWERHTEVSSWTFFQAPDGAKPFAGKALERVPRDWITALPGEVLVGARMEVRDDLTPAAGRAAFGTEAVGSAVMGGHALAMTDFRADASGMTRFLLIDEGGDATRTGRLVQALLEIETYRLLALLAFPVAGKVGRALASIEARAADLAQDLSEAGTPETDKAMLDALAALAGETEALIGRHGFRFDAGAAYHRLVNDRIDSLREARVDGLTTIAEFMQRRLEPAMRTCDAVAARQQAAIARIARMTQMLNTRVQVASEATSAALLASMDRRSGQQLRLQQTVEGLSTVAIAYYAVALLLFPLKALETAWPRFDATIAAGGVAPVIVILVWLGLRRWRRTLNAE